MILSDAERNDSNTVLEVLKAVVQQFVDERDWQQFHSPKNLAMSIAIEAAELMEIFQWLRVDESVEETRAPEVHCKIKEELADVLIYCLNMACVANIDLTSSILQKIESNKLRFPVSMFKGRFKPLKSD